MQGRNKAKRECKIRRTRHPEVLDDKFAKTIPSLTSSDAPGVFQPYQGSDPEENPEGTQAMFAKVAILGGKTLSMEYPYLAAPSRLVSRSQLDAIDQADLVV